MTELPASLHQLLQQCIGSNGVLELSPDSICPCCYGILKSFEDFQIQTKKSNAMLEDLLKAGINQCVEENETIDASSFVNVKLEDPLNCVDFEIKNERASPQTSYEEILENNMEAEIIKAETSDVFFSVANSDEEIICKYGCGKTFRRISSVKAHYRIKHAEQEKIGRGNNGNDDADTNDSASDDDDWQMPGPEEIVEPVERKFECNVCHRKYVDKSTLRTHARLHLGKLPFQCEKCERSFNKKIRLTKHMAEMHGDAPLSLECKYGCGKVFQRYHALDNHHSDHRMNRLDSIKTKKNDKVVSTKPKIITPKESFICEDCGQVLPNVSKLREHSFRHLPPEERPYKCEDCNRTFIAKRTFEEHRIRHAGIKNFACDICGWKTFTEREVKKHKNVHTKDNQVSCMLCSKVYADRKTLQRHIENVHQGLKKYKCRYCDQAFAKSDVRNRHELEHGAERPHKCKLCDESFYMVSKLSSHINSAHKFATSTTTTTVASVGEESAPIEMQACFLDNIC